MDLTAVLRRHGTTVDPSAALERSTRATAPGTASGTSPEDALEWSWPPYAPVESADEPFDTVEWAPSSVVWHPQVRVGRWTVVYRRS